MRAARTGLPSFICCSFSAATGFRHLTSCAAPAQCRRLRPDALRVEAHVVEDHVVDPARGIDLPDLHLADGCGAHFQGEGQRTDRGAIEPYFRLARRAVDLGVELQGMPATPGTH